jgi:uroporphyrinogen-III synthase
MSRGLGAQKNASPSWCEFDPLLTLCRKVHCHSIAISRVTARTLVDFGLNLQAALDAPRWQ